MSKSIVFVDDCSDFCSKPTFAVSDSNATLILNDASELQIIRKSVPNKHIRLASAIQLSPAETVVAARLVRGDRLLVTTSFFNFHLVLMDGNDEPLSAQSLPFKYGRNMKASPQLSLQIVQNHVVFGAGRFIFALNLESFEFKILKLFSSDVSRFRVSSTHLFVLTRRDFQVFALEVQGNTLNVSAQGRAVIEPETYTHFELWRGGVVFLSTKFELVFRSLAGADLPVTSKLKLTSMFSGDTELTFLTSFGDQTLVVGSKATTYTLSQDLTKIKSGFSNNRYGALLTPSGLVPLSSARSPVPNLRLGNLVHEAYTKENKRQKFDSKAIPQQLAILKIYLIKKALEQKSFANPVQLLRELMQKIVLKKTVVKDPGMKSMVIEFFESLKCFTIERFGKCYIGKPRVQATATVPPQISGTGTPSVCQTSTESVIGGKKGSFSEAETAESLNGSPQQPVKTKSVLPQDPSPAASQSRDDSSNTTLNLQLSRAPSGGQAHPVRRGSKASLAVVKRLDFGLISVKKDKIRKNKKGIFRAAIGKIRKVLREQKLHDTDRLHWLFYLARKFRMGSFHAWLQTVANHAVAELCFRGQKKLLNSTRV